ncbi:MAG: LPS assembly protein LptD, partial [Hyphomicrobiales bacterium]|nr:LPS assembly protein LptD [Hyphomicrobiales bacterium]
VFEPIAQIVSRTDVDDQTNVPNDDALSLVYDDTLLFDTDKFSGYDRIEGGTRANVGVRYTMQHNNGGYLRAVLGQSYQVAGSNEFAADSGLATTRSDYVTGLYYQPMHYLSFVAQARFDEDDVNLQRIDLAGNANYGAFSSSVIYANLQAQPGLGIPTDRQEIQANGSIALTEHWSLLGQIRYDLELEERVTDSISIKYHDDCFALSVSYNETFIRDRDIEPDEQVLLRFELKHLGAFDVDASSVGGG